MHLCSIGVDSVRMMCVTDFDTKSRVTIQITPLTIVTVLHRLVGVASVRNGVR